MLHTLWMNLEKNSKWNKPVTKDCILYDSIHIKYLEKANLYRQKVI